MTKKIEVYKGKYKGHDVGIYIACDGIDELGEVFTIVDGEHRHDYNLFDLINGVVSRTIRYNINGGKNDILE